MPVTIKLAWNPNPSSEAVSGYEVLQSINGGPFSHYANVTAPNIDVLNPAPGAYAWQVRASNFVGVGPLSSAVDGPTLPSTPSTPTVTVILS